MKINTVLFLGGFFGILIIFFVYMYHIYYKKLNYKSVSATKSTYLSHCPCTIYKHKKRTRGCVFYIKIIIHLLSLK